MNYAKKALDIVLFIVGALFLIGAATVLVKALNFVPLSTFGGSFNPIWLSAVLGIWAAVVYLIAALVARLLWHYEIEVSDVVGFEVKTIGLTVFVILVQIPFVLFANSDLFYLLNDVNYAEVHPFLYAMNKLLYYICGAVGGLGLCLCVIATLANCIKMMGKKGAE